MSSDKNAATEMWDQRYSQTDYVYGIQPNEFLKQELAKLSSGTILLPSEGEGRNAVYAALQGWQVDAFDISNEAKNKAEKLAEANQVKINYQIHSLENVDLKKNSFDVIALIYAHNDNREFNHKRIVNALKPEGTLIIEGFSKNQINKNSGGPKNHNFLFSIDELKSDFEDLQIISIEETETDLNEGILHNRHCFSY